MSTSGHTNMKAFQRRLDAKLAKARVQTHELEARAREKKAQTEIAALQAARKLIEQIDHKRQDLEDAVSRKVDEVQNRIWAANIKLDTSLKQLASKLKSESKTRSQPRRRSKTHSRTHLAKASRTRDRLLGRDEIDS